MTISTHTNCNAPGEAMHAIHFGWTPARLILPLAEGRHPGELRENARLGTQGTQVEGDKNNKISESSQMRNEKIERERTEKNNDTKIAQISPGEGLSEGL